MRVLHVFKTYYPDTVGGIEQVIRQLCVGTRPLGVESEVLTLSRDVREPTIVFDGHVVHRARLDLEVASTGFSLSAIGQLALLAKDFDVVHYQFPWPFMDIAHFMARIKQPTVVSYQSDIVKQKNLLKIYRPLRDRFLSSVDKIVATSPNYLASSAVLQQFRHKVSIIPLGLDKASFPEPDQALLDNWRARCGDRFFLFVGVLRYYKGLHILLDALQHTNFPVVIAGGGPIEQELKAQVARLGLQNVTFLGRVSELDKIALLKLCYGFVFPSHLRSEAFGLSLLEAAMYGKPMICADIGTGTSYINVDGETGLVVPPDNPAAFRVAMQTLWDQPERAARMGEAAERRYQAMFTTQLMAERYVALYQELCQKKMR